jgi:uncharacterized membrane protein YeiB
MSGEIEPAPEQPKSPALNTPEFIDRFFQNQSRELDLREQELKIQQINAQNVFSYSSAALQVQGSFLEGESKRRHSRVKTALFVGAALCVVVLGFLLTIILYGHEQIAIELIKAVAYICGGGAGGYGLARFNDSARSGDQTSSVATQPPAPE